jgi:hypothetical protein
MPRIANLKLHFTEWRVLKFACPLDRHAEIYRYAEVPGLGVRVTPKQQRSYICERRIHGRCMRTMIGDVLT